MTTPRLVRALACGLVSAACAGCAVGHGGSLVPMPRRPTDDLVDEIRARHADLVDAVRLGDTTRLGRNLMKDAMLVTPLGDTARGIPAITRQLFALRAAKVMETVRGTTGSGVVRCYDGVLEQVGEWSISTQAADSSLHFERGPMGIQWVTRGDSLGAMLIDMSSPSISLPQSGCVSVAQTRYDARRIDAFYSFGFFTPFSFQHATEHRLNALGYTPANSHNPTIANGLPPAAAQIVGVSGRLTSRLWLTVTAPRQVEYTDVGRCNPSNYNYVHVQRQHRAIGLMLDVHLPHGLTAGVGPAFASNQYHYNEYDLGPAFLSAGDTAVDGLLPNPGQFFHECGSDVVQTVYDSSDVSKQSVGAAGDVRYQMRISQHAALFAQVQLFSFPTAAAPTTSRGMSLAFRDFTTTLGWGLSVTF